MNKLAKRVKQSKNISKKIQIMINDKEISKSFSDIQKQIEVLWKDEHLIDNTEDAIYTVNSINYIISQMTTMGKLSVNRLSQFYTMLFYLEDFINSSIIQNRLISSYYGIIKEYIHNYESGKLKIKIF